MENHKKNPTFTHLKIEVGHYLYTLTAIRTKQKETVNCCKACIITYKSY